VLRRTARCEYDTFEGSGCEDFIKIPILEDNGPI
jgi:hypothetical protein